MSILVKNGKIVNADRTFEADVLIDGGKIVKVGEKIEAPKGCKIIDAKGKLVMPGGIEPHCHLAMPFMGTVSYDDYYSGSRMAIAGGTTSLFDFIIPAPNQSYLEAYEIWKKKAELACCDFGQHMAVTWYSPSCKEEFNTLIHEHGINTFKHFLAYKGALMLDDEKLLQSFATLRDLGALPMVHAENGDMVVAGQQRMIDLGITGPEGHPQSRPSHVEGEAADRAINIAKHVNVPLYIVHNTCKESAEAVARARLEGQRVIGEAVLPHLMCDDAGCYDPDWDFASQFILSPPLRPKGHTEVLWNHLSAGSLQIIGTDHCVFTRKQKNDLGRHDFRKIPNGMNGIEERMSCAWELGVKKGRLTEEQFVAATSTNAAKVFNCYPQKGVIQEGSDADLIIWNPDDVRVIEAATHHSRIEYNCYEGEKVRGFPEITMAGGEIKWEVSVVGGIADWKNGKLTEEKNGKYIKRKPFASVVYGAMDAVHESAKPRKVERA